MQRNEGMKKWIARAAALLFSAGFSIYLAKGGSGWIPNWVPLVIMLAAGIVWLATAESVQTLVLLVVRTQEGKIIDPSTHAPMQRSRIETKKAIVLIVFVMGLCSALGMAAWRYRKQARAEQQEAGDGFSVILENKLVSFGGDYVTGFWLEQPGPNGCMLSPAQMVLFFRITNLKPFSTMITHFSVEGSFFNSWRPLTKLKIQTGQILWVSRKGLPLTCTRGVPINFPEPQGEGSLLNSRIADEDFERACVVELSTLDSAIANRDLVPHQPIRGWAFFQVPDSASVNIRVNITDEVGKLFNISCLLGMVTRMRMQ
jgi:hypothetical protein